jgi:hypothetical protein
MCRDPEDILLWAKEKEYRLTKRIEKDGQVAELPEL